MRVICIDGIKEGDEAYDTPHKAGANDAIYEGETYTVYKQKTYSGILCYFLIERRANAAYASHCFIPLSNIDELELQLTNSKYELV